MRAPGGGSRDNSRGPRLPQRSFPQSPLRLRRRYSKRPPLTVLLRPQVQNYSLTRLRLISVGATASAIQQFLGWPVGGRHQVWRKMPPTRRQAECAQCLWLTHEWRRQPVECRRGHLRPNHRQQVCLGACGCAKNSATQRKERVEGIAGRGRGSSHRRLASGVRDRQPARLLARSDLHRSQSPAVLDNVIKNGSTLR